jgi:hypothetical protein
MFLKPKVIRKSIACLAITFIIALNCPFLVTHGNWLYCRGVQKRELVQHALIFWWIFLLIWSLFSRKTVLHSFFLNILVFPLSLFLCALAVGIKIYSAWILIGVSASPVLGVVYWLLNKFEFND